MTRNIHGIVFQGNQNIRMFKKYEVGVIDWDIIGMYYADSPTDTIQQAKEDMKQSGLIKEIPKEYKNNWYARLAG